MTTQPVPDMNEYAVKFLDIQQACTEAHEMFFKELDSAFGVQIPPKIVKNIYDHIYEYSQNTQDEYESSPLVVYEDLDTEIFTTAKIQIEEAHEFFIPHTWLEETPNKVFEMYISEIFSQSGYKLTTSEFQELFETCDIDTNLTAAFWIVAQNAIQGFYYKQFDKLRQEYPNLPFYPNFLNGYDIYYYYEPSTC